MTTVVALESLGKIIQCIFRYIIQEEEKKEKKIKFSYLWFF